VGGLEKFQRSKRLLSMLGNPQNTHKTIHVAGTSGKGTVCYMIDAILRAHNKTTGLLVSPHVYDIRERVQINNQYAPEKSYIKECNEVIEKVIEMSRKNDAPNYYDTMLAIGFLITSKKNLDYIIVESGFGGRYDMSNTIEDPNKYCVITQIGLDHTRILGTTFEQIALEKSHIMKPGVWATILKQKESVNQVLENTGKLYKAKISWVNPYGNYEIDDLLIALDTTKNIAYRDGWVFDEEIAKEAATKVYIPGRFEKRNKNNQLVILDGAHNYQKLTALSDRLERESLAPANIIVAFSEHNEYKKSLEPLKPVCKKLIICEFFLERTAIKRRAISSDLIKQAAIEIGFNDIEIIKQPIQALEEALKYPETVVVTGSFYLLGEIDSVF